MYPMLIQDTDETRRYCSVGPSRDFTIYSLFQLKLAVKWKTKIRALVTHLVSAQRWLITYDLTISMLGTASVTTLAIYVCVGSRFIFARGKLHMNTCTYIFTCKYVSMHVCTEC